MGDQGDQKASRSVNDLRPDAYNRGRRIAEDFAAPGDMVPSGAEMDARIPKLVEMAWRKGFAAGWAARDTRDDEPDVGAMVWLRDEEGDECVAWRRLERGNAVGNGLEAVWEVTGRPELMAWSDLVDEAVEWGRLTREGR